MPKKNNTINIAGIEVKVVPEEVIFESQCPMVAVRLDSHTKKLLDDNTFLPRSKAGYFCSLCNAECILAPSGQAIFAVGRNKLICMDCMISMKGGEDQ